MDANDLVGKLEIGEIKLPAILGPGGNPFADRELIIGKLFDRISVSRGKKIRVTPSELMAVSNKLSSIAENYTSIYTQLMQQAQSMGAAWEGADNLAFVEQITGFCEELKSMADKINSASSALQTQAQNYENRQNDNIAQVRKLTK